VADVLTLDPMPYHLFFSVLFCSFLFFSFLFFSFLFFSFSQGLAGTLWQMC
jgi:hypothetical protein